MTGRPVEEVRQVIAQAERERAVLGYKALINWDKVPGGEQVWALIEVKVTPQRDVGFDAIAERISRFPDVHSVYLVSGQFDLSVMVVGKTMQEVAAFVSNKLAPMEPVQGTNTHYLLKRYKDWGEPLNGGEGVQRLAVSP